MPRRQFIVDLEKAQRGILPPGITNVKAGDDDGQIEFYYTIHADDPAAGLIKITAMIPDLAEYPKTHDYIIFSDDQAPPNVASALTNVRGTDRKTVLELLDIISASLSRSVEGIDGDSEMADASDSEDEVVSDDDRDIYDSDHEAFGGVTPIHTSAIITDAAPMAKTYSDRGFRARIRSDLRLAKAAGFRIGYLGHLLEGYNCFVTLSIRMAKLGISEEAMQAWQVEAAEYLILIIQYPNGYKPSEDLQRYSSAGLSSHVLMKVVASKTYKPTLQDAIKAFSVAGAGHQHQDVSNSNPASTERSAEQHPPREVFISKALAGLLNERLVHILRFRSTGMDWIGAENWFNVQSSQGYTLSQAKEVPSQYFEPEKNTKSFPPIIRSDHFADTHTSRRSFPLLAMQFMLRHFVRCTEFCLVCHRKLDIEVEAIKPYVCDQGLCLYQYMTLGFGPSIEHEILAQPYVVDLLISFCYLSASERKLVDMPKGLSLIVPYVDCRQYGTGAQSEASISFRSSKEPRIHEIGFDQAKGEIIFADEAEKCPVKKGSWIVLSLSSDQSKEFHCRVSDITYYPTISVDSPVQLQPRLPDEKGRSVYGIRTPEYNKPAVARQRSAKWADAAFYVYDRDFEHLNKEDQCVTICKLLDTLPKVTEMREYLMNRRSGELKNWPQRISPPALSLLRWIIASNRACIMQVDGNKDDTEEPRGSSEEQVSVPVPKKKPQERVAGMQGFMQFRFAMGAPDKEQRFLNEVRKTAARLRLDHPTIFAWHGSPIFNWHMIIREGLHYKNRAHGRAFGDGVYHAKDVTISGGYAHGGGHSSAWPMSVLRISSAIALNEIVNAPAEFTHRHPYYVVQHLDWIQTRFLFVRCSPESDGFCLDSEIKPAHAHQQDPFATPRGVSNTTIVIPASAIPSARVVPTKRSHASTQRNKGPLKKIKALVGIGKSSASKDENLDDGIDDDDDEDDANSVSTDIQDREILVDEPDAYQSNIATGASMSEAEKKTSAMSAITTDFEPGKLDFSTLPIMPLPTYASSATTKCLMKELQTLRKAQDSTPPAELGWYIDVEKIDNVYQWIVELHSFHCIEVGGKPIPLAADMKKKGVKSIVLEVRFNKDFPYTPPYIRVIRPRFLSLAQGGGGHVVIGGAMCMELLTNTGWSSVSSMESVLMQVRLAMASEPFARLDMRNYRDYGVGEAASGYIRAAQGHGWQVPPGFSEMAYGTGNEDGST